MRRSKYGNVKTFSDGIVFASKKEAARYQELKLLQTSKQISKLDLQHVFKIIIKGKLICKYIADFIYLEKGKWVVEDVKGRRTDIFNLKWKLMQAVYPEFIYRIT